MGGPKTTRFIQVFLEVQGNPISYKSPLGHKGVLPLLSSIPFVIGKQIQVP